jgi:hypothetical protein
MIPLLVQLFPNEESINIIPVPWMLAHQGRFHGIGRLVSYDDVRALLGVMSGERDVSKGIITTTSDFPPNIEKDPYIAPFLPTRLELMNSVRLQNWLAEIQNSP